MQCKHNNTTYRPGRKLPPPRKEYICFQIDGKTAQLSRCAKSGAFTIAIDIILEIE